MDGTASALIYYSLNNIIDTEVVFCERKNGYGLQKQYYDKMKQEGISLLITGDIGITAKDEVAYGNELGVQTIVTDHHNPQCDKTPDCLILNPKVNKDDDYWNNLCGGAVVYVLMKKLYKMLDLPFDEDGTLLQFCTISLIGDMVPLIGTNRLLVIEGMKNLRETKNKALSYLLGRSFGDNVDTSIVSFYIAPMTNSMNRIGDIYQVFKFFTSEDDSEIERLFEIIHANNELRKTYQSNSIELAKLYIERNKIEKNRFMYLNLKSNKSINGLVSSYVTNYYGKPSVVVSEKDGILAGSGRALGAFDASNIISSVSEYCLNVGGHFSAFGLSFSAQNEQKILEKINSLDSKLFPTYYKTIDMEIDKDMLSNMSFMNEYMSLAPFGQGNEEPMFFTRAMKITQVKTTERHSFLVFNNNNASVWEDCEVKGNLFNYIIDQEYKVGDLVDIVYTINADCSINIDAMKHDLSKQIFKSFK